MLVVCERRMSANQENHGGTLVVRVERLNCNNVDIHGPLVATVFCFIWFIFLIDIIFAFTQENIFYILSHLTTTKTPSCMWMANGITKHVRCVLSCSDVRNWISWLKNIQLLYLSSSSHLQMPMAFWVILILIHFVLWVWLLMVTLHIATRTKINVWLICIEIYFFLQKFWNITKTQHFLTYHVV